MKTLLAIALFFFVIYAGDLIVCAIGIGRMDPIHTSP